MKNKSLLKTCFVVIHLILFVTIINISLKYKKENHMILNDNDSKLVEPIIDCLLDIKNEVHNSIILKKYKKFYNIIYNDLIKNNFDKEFTPQGITIVDNYIFISGYYENKNKSQVIILDLNGNIINKVKLDTNSHVGSISYDKNNELVWIPGNNGNLLAYNKKDFIYENNVKNKYKIEYVKNELYDYINNDKYNIAFLTVDDKYIYIGNFYQRKKCLVKKYFINNNGDEIKLDYIGKFKLPSRVQGILFYKRDDKTYLITSSSYNRFKKSKLKIYEYDELITDYSNKSIKVFEMPPMSEQISIYNDYGFLVFESGSKKYYNALDKIENIIIIDMEKAFE